MKYLKVIGVDGVVLGKFMLPLGIDQLTSAEWKFPVPLYHPISIILIEEEEEN